MLTVVVIGFDLRCKALKKYRRNPDILTLNHSEAARLLAANRLADSPLMLVEPQITRNGIFPELESLARKNETLLQVAGSPEEAADWLAAFLEARKVTKDDGEPKQTADQKQARADGQKSPQKKPQYKRKKCPSVCDMPVASGSASFSTLCVPRTSFVPDSPKKWDESWCREEKSGPVFVYRLPPH